MFAIYKYMIKWARRVIEWKKVNVNKVSDSFDICQQLAIILLEELERLSIDMFIESKEGMPFDDTVKSVDIDQDYIHFIQNYGSTNNRRKYMFGYIIMATEFRRYWTACKCGDRVVMESI